MRRWAAAGARASAPPWRAPRGRAARSMATRRRSCSRASGASRPMRREKPALVVTSLTPFGQSGPAANWRASNLVAHASGGILSLTGVAGRPPLQTGGDQAWMLLGLNGFAATVTAYYGALAHGEGDWLDLAAQACAAGMLELYGPRAAFDHLPAPRLGNRV